MLMLGTAAFLAATPAAAADIVGASYDAARDEIVVDIVYRGTRPAHEFTVEWGRCYRGDAPPAGVAGRLIDRQGDEIASEEFYVRERLGLQDLPCRPAEVTLRLGRVSHARVLVPEAPRAE